MRKIQTQDVFKLAKIIKTADLKSELTGVVRAGENIDGVELMMTLFSACGEDKVEALLYELIGNISEHKAEAIKTMELKDITDLMSKIAEENDLANFFKTAVKLT